MSCRVRDIPRRTGNPCYIYTAPLCSLVITPMTAGRNRLHDLWRGSFSVFHRVGADLVRARLLSALQTWG